MSQLRGRRSGYTLLKEASAFTLLERLTDTTNNIQVTQSRNHDLPNVNHYILTFHCDTYGKNPHFKNVLHMNQCRLASLQLEVRAVKTTNR